LRDLYSTRRYVALNQENVDPNPLTLVQTALN